MAAWLTADTVTDEEWNQPPDADVLDLYLSTARSHVLAYASRAVRARLTAEDADPDAVPANLVLAQLTHAKNLWHADTVSPSGDIGEDSFAYRPHPLDWIVKQIIRPKGGAPRAR